MIKHRKFIRNKFGVSIMYDAVLFVVMVSLSGVILIPAMHSNIVIESSVETHREHVVDDALNTFLVSRLDNFSYKVCGDIIDDIAGRIGIDNSSNGLYGKITNWLLAREQNHKTYSTLIAENLGCQLRLPISILNENRFNFLTGDFDRKLKNETIIFFDKYLGDKYNYNLTAIWHPIKGVNFGGEIFIGQSPPDINCHVASSYIMMPYSPVINIGSLHIEFTRYWINNTLFGNIFGKIVFIENLSKIISDYVNLIPPFDNYYNSTLAIKENVSNLVDGFFIDGIKNENNITIFPGIVNITVTYWFEKLKNAISNFTENTVNSFMGESFGSVDKVFSDLNNVIGNPIANGITEKINQTIKNILQTNFGSLFDAFELLETCIKQNISIILKNFIGPYIDIFIDFVFNFVENYFSQPISFLINNIKEQLSIWLLDRISINKAKVTLSIWEARS